MRNHLFFVLSLWLLCLSCGPSRDTANDLAGENPIYCHIDLSATSDDKVPVTIDPGRFLADSVIFRLPRVVQGTYAISDFGSFIDDLNAYDYNGEKLSVKKFDRNSWVIYGAKGLDSIRYWVNDTFDVEGSGVTTPFSPSGTNIEPGIYVLNLPGFVGYFDSFESSSYLLDVTAPVRMKSASALRVVEKKTSVDQEHITTRYQADRYFDVTDNPMMYGQLDIEEFEVGDISIRLSVYSPSGVHSAEALKPAFYKMMEAQKSFLGAINSTTHYDIFLYLSANGQGAPTGFGALEHHTSTVVVMPDAMDTASLETSLIDLVAHEFFHILTPLTVHSEDIHNFDYNDPTFSKHLWMYEGLTEYFAVLFQVNRGLFTEEEFYGKLYEKINAASTYDDEMSFTEMSENILDNPYASNYSNVYQKGALIGMCLDLIIREESNGKRGILSVMKELSDIYGKDRPFEDDQIIQEIVGMTYPSVGAFFEEHVIHGKPIDYNIYFEKVGLGIKEGRVETNYVQNSGRMIVRGDRKTGYIKFNDEVKNNSFWNDNGAKPNDIIYEIDGVVLTRENGNAVFGEVFGWQPGREVDVLLKRDGKDIRLHLTVTPTFTQGKVLGEKDVATDGQKELRIAWLRN